MLRKRREGALLALGWRKVTNIVVSVSTRAAEKCDLFVIGAGEDTTVLCELFNEDRLLRRTTTTTRDG